MLALSSDGAQVVTVAVSGVLLALSWVAFKFVKAVTTKAIMLIVLLGSLTGVWSQRNDVTECADKVRKNLLKQTACDFFGFSIDVGIPTGK